jgi:hypothetical protein
MERRAPTLDGFTFWDPEHEWILHWLGYLLLRTLCVPHSKRAVCVRAIEASIIRSRILDALWDITHSNDSEEFEPRCFKICAAFINSRIPRREKPSRENDTWNFHTLEDHRSHCASPELITDLNRRNLFRGLHVYTSLKTHLITFNYSNMHSGYT